MEAPLYFLCALVGYLLGSVSFGVLLSRKLGRDIRTVGSRGTGASNMLRAYGRRPGTLTFIGDCAKAAAAVGAGYLLHGHTGGMIAGLLAVIGHNWPVFFGFRGGKGIACCTAVFVLTYPIEGAIAIALCAGVIALTRYVSLGSMLMLLSFAVMITITRGLWPFGAWALALMVLGVWRHKENIGRLLRGKERKLGDEGEKISP